MRGNVKTRGRVSKRGNARVWGGKRECCAAAEDVEGWCVVAHFLP